MRLAIIMFATILALSSTAHAAPDRVTFTARLQDAGKPIDGAVTIKLDLYRAINGGTAVWTESHSASAAEGLVSIGMGEQTKLDTAVLDGTLFLEITVNATVLSPRLAIGSVPYALSARNADKLGDVPADGWQRRIAAACPSNSSISAIQADGTVTCEADDDTKNTFAGGLVESNGTVTTDPAVLQRRITGACPAGSSISAIDATGNVSCEPDDNTTYAAGSGVLISPSNVISPDFAVTQRRVGGSCAVGSSIRTVAADGSVTCEPDTDTTYSIACPSNEFVRAMNSNGVAGCGTVSSSTLSAISNAGVSTSTSTTTAKAFCGLTKVQGLNVDDPRCTLTVNTTTDIWTLTADSTSATNSQMICEARCF